MTPKDIGIIAAVLALLLVFAIITILMTSTTPFFDQTQKSALDQQYNDYGNLLHDDVSKLNNISQGYPSNMTDQEYITYANEYVPQLQTYKLHIQQFKRFIANNEDALKSVGYDTSKITTSADNDLASISESASQIDQILRDIEQRQPVASDLFNVLAALITL